MRHSSTTSVHHLVLIASVALVILLSSVDASRHRRQASNSTIETRQSTALQPSSSTANALATLRKLIMPTLRSIVQAPIRVIQELIAEMRQFMMNHNFSDMFNSRFFHQLFTEHLPARVRHYWSTFLEMENECIQRTLCDVADFTTHHVPHWFKQILLVYFTTFNQNVYFEAINNGLIVHNCQAKFSECDPNSFLSRISTNMSNSIHTTVEPINKALNELINVTMSTLDVAMSSTEAPPPVAPSSNQIESNMIVDDTINDFEEDEEFERRLSQPSNDHRSPPPIAYVVHQPAMSAPPMAPPMNYHQQQPPASHQPPQVPRPPAAGWALDNRQPPPQPQPQYYHLNN